MRKILFRADAKPSIGTGDLVSLIHLSRYFEKTGWQAHFIIRGYATGINLIKKHQIKNCFTIGEDIPIVKEVEAINDYIRAKEIDVIFFEITERPLTEYKDLTEKAVKCCINFDGVIPDNMALVVDWDVGAENLFDAKNYPNTKFLLGLEYVVLPIDFNFSRISKRQYRSKPEVILVTMGGADELNFTQKIVDLLIRNKTGSKLNIIIGEGYRERGSLETSLKVSSIDYEVKQNVIDMFEEYINCDVAIAAGGLTAFELIAARTPSILIATYEHQIERCRYFNKMGWTKYSGFRSFNEKALLENIRKPLTDLPKNIFKVEQIRSCMDGLLQRH